MTYFLRVLLLLGLLAGSLFGSAGRWDLPFFWAYLGLWAILLLVFLITADPGLLRERLRPPPGGQGRLLRLVLAPFLIGALVVAGLDVGRFHWSDTVPLAVQLAALTGFGLGLAWGYWCMMVNRFFAPAIRIQTERGHYVITTGPYRFVRHPGYLGMIVTALCSGPALGSWWSMLPAAGYVVVILGRTVREDRFLHRELAGYAEYAAKVRYRLVPGAW